MNQKDLEETILSQIDKTSKITKSYTQKEFDKMDLGITIDQWFLLIIIAESTQISQKELAEKSLRDPASITRTMELLTKKDFVSREPIANNKRQYNLVLTFEGDNFVKKHKDGIDKQRQKSTKGFSKDELVMFNALLKRIQKNMC
jgi:MarR family transcriptional regulator for hemolysin